VGPEAQRQGRDHGIHGGHGKWGGKEKRGKDTKCAKKSKELLHSAIADFVALGYDEHILADYGDELTRKVPWDLFDRDAALAALDTARKCLAVSQCILRNVSGT
jgi:hypothetical protein